MSHSPAPTVRSASNDASKSLTAIGWLAAALVIGLLVLGVGWYQYLQIDRVTQASVRGRDNLIWDFYKLELQLANVQLALREVRAQPARSNAVAELVDEYNILVSQVQLLQTLNSGLVMRGHESFASAMVAAHAFIDKTDVYLAETPKLLTSSVVQGLLRDSAELRRPLHRLVLDAYLVENERASTELKEIRRFTVYYGMTSTFLIVLTLWAGWLVLRNLTFKQRRQAQQSEVLREKKDLAEAAAQAKSRFLSAASHDLRQPAHALGLFVSQLAPMATNPQARRLLAGANAAVQDMQNMLDGLFDLSRLDAPTTQVQLKALPLESVFEQLRNGFGCDAAAKGLRLRVRGTDVWVHSDPVLLHRILLNLVSNAIRYTDNGAVLVACRPGRQAGSVRLEVRDSGVGIAPADHDKIFQEFHQVNNPQRDRTKGLGVGLAIVQRCCRLLNTTITVRSALGCGACFSLTLARVASQNTALRADGGAETLANELVGLRVLVVDDDALGCEALAGLLASWGCRVTAVHGLQDALAQCQRGQWPDLIVSDFRLADAQNGVTLVHVLRERAGRPIAACVISGDTDAKVVQQVQAAGLVLLGKPVRPAKLRGLLRHLVSERVD